MARTSKVDPCLLCDCAPCECNATSKKSSPKSPAKKSAPNAKSSAIDAMKARVLNPEPVSASPVRIISDDPAVITEEDEFRAAILALAPILHHDELVKYRVVVGNPDTRVLSTRAREWRERHGL